MAIIKKLKTRQGIDVEYHNINIYKNTVDGYLELTINSYVNAETRQEYLPVERENMTVPQNMWKSRKDNTSLEEVGYAYLKTLDKFKGAEDEL